ncbi:MAG: CHAD domain-containing protein, partial [Bacteroidales bacterium]
MIPDQVRIKDIKPALSGYITQSLRLLKRSSVPDDDAVHDIRVLMKKARATMKLLTPQIDEKTFEREYNSFKEAGLLLASLRETSVHRKTLKSIRKSHRGLFSRLETNEKIRNILKKESDIILSEEQKKRLLHLEEILVKSLYRIRFLQMNSLN